MTYAVVHGGVTLGGFANTGDLFIDILKNGASLGIGSTTKNIGISTVARTSVTTGVVEVAEGDYFELAIRVVQDASVTLQPLGTFFSCHASSTEIGGFSPDTNDYVNDIHFGVSGQDVTLTLDRTGTLPSISGMFTLPAGGGGLTEAAADARYLQLIGGTLAGPGRLTIDVVGNSEALVINHPGGLSESALHTFTNTIGAQKAMQASRSGQSTAWFSVEGSLGGGNTKPGIAFGGGTGARDTELYRDSANNWKTPDFFHRAGLLHYRDAAHHLERLGHCRCSGRPSGFERVRSDLHRTGRHPDRDCAPCRRRHRDGSLCHKYHHHARFEQPAKVHNPAHAQRRPANAHHHAHRAA